MSRCSLNSSNHCPAEPIPGSTLWWRIFSSYLVWTCSDAVQARCLFRLCYLPGSQREALLRWGCTRTEWTAAEGTWSSATGPMGEMSPEMSPTNSCASSAHNQERGQNTSWGAELRKSVLMKLCTEVITMTRLEGERAPAFQPWIFTFHDWKPVGDKYKTKHWVFYFKESV